MVKLTFPDGSVQEFAAGVTGNDVAKKIGERLARDAVAIKVNDVLLDLSAPINEDAKIQIITFNDKEGKEIFWHSSSHILSMAVKEIWPDVKLTIGPAIDNGFYYDFEKKEPFKPEDLEVIEKKMEEIVKKDLPFKRKEISQEEAKELFKDNKFKLEMAEEFKEKLTVYSSNGFTDLCRGPHVPSTGRIKSFKLTKISSAYWRGDSSKESLQRVYGISFPDKKDLKDYLKMLEEAEKRNHIKIGAELDIFSMHEEGPGFPFFHPKGMILRTELINFWREEHRKAGYVEIMTPTMLRKFLWEQSGHWNNYKENMYTTKIDNDEYAIKPMNCPGGMLIYKTNVHSYKELPLRVGELGHVHRHELSGVLNGLFRVRAFTQDDAHIFCSEEQLENEILNVLALIKEMLGKIGFTNYEYTLSVRSEKKKDKYLGTDEGWNYAETAIKNAMKKIGAPFSIEEGEAKFYGPSLDVQIKDALGRKWQCSTIQVDFNLPERFDITYEGKDGKKHRPIMLHRVVYGSLERFMGILIEHYAGKFPLWLNPNQVIILPVADRFAEYASEVAKSLTEAGIRCEVDARTESISRKVRDAELQRYNYILVVGEKEIGDKTVTVRTRENQVEGMTSYEEFKARVVKEINEKKL